MTTAETWGILAAALAACLVAVELFFRLPFIAQIEAVNRASMRVLDVVRSPRISDHWKEKVLPRYAGHILLASLRLGGLLLLCAACFTVVYLAVGWLFFRDVGAVAETLGQGWVQWLLLGIGVAWAFVRTRIGRTADRAADDHSPASKMLHRLALGGDGIRDLSFRLDGAIARKAAARIDVDRPVYVTGLARAGTTIVLEALYASGEFTSLTYRDMPFVMAPYTWGKIAGRRGDGAKRERAHGDRLEIGLDSPETFEEVFWSTCAGRITKNDGGLTPTGAPDADAIDRYRDYVRRILARHGRDDDGRRYLAKDNNHVLRIHWLKAAFPNAVIVTPFRDPVTHAASLMRQHRRFLERRGDDAFSLEYMNWLGHHEFGANHRPFLVGGHDVPANADALLEPRYWLDYWAAVYGYLLDRHGDDLVWMDYERLCREPPATLAALEAHAGLAPGTLQGYAGRISAPPAREYPDIEAAVDGRVRNVHTRLRARVR